MSDSCNSAAECGGFADCPACGMCQDHCEMEGCGLDDEDCELGDDPAGYDEVEW